MWLISGAYQTVEQLKVISLGYTILTNIRVVWKDLTGQTLKRIKSIHKLRPQKVFITLGPVGWNWQLIYTDLPSVSMLNVVASFSYYTEWRPTLSSLPYTMKNTIIFEEIENKLFNSIPPSWRPRGLNILITLIN